MKKLLALLIALMLLSLSALAEPTDYLDYTEDILEDGSPIYDFPELSLRLPADWRDKVTAVRENGGTAFYQTGSYTRYKDEGIDGGGFLFALGVSKDGSFSALPAFRYLGFSEASALNYYLMLPTDYPAYMGDDAVRAEYDAMYAQLDDVAANVSFHPERAESEPSFGDSASPAAAGASADAALTPAQARYQFEHRMLPRYFYDRPESVLNGVKEVGVYWLWESVSTENGIAPTYPAEDYVEHWYSSDDDTIILQVEMPEPDADTLCYRVYFVYNAETGNTGYYTVEYNNFLGETSFLCGWTRTHEHVNYGGLALLDRRGADYEAALRAEAEQVAKLAGVSPTLIPADMAIPRPVETAGSDDSPDAGLSLIACPELGFTTMADPAYPWDYQEGTGISIYTEGAGRIPYVIVWRSEDLIVEALGYIREQYTPYMQKQYGDDLVSYVEYEVYEIGGKQLPAGLYTYRLQGYLIDLLRVYDSTGDRTVAYTAKYIKERGDATLAALDTAIRCFQAD